MLMSSDESTPAHEPTSLIVEAPTPERSELASEPSTLCLNCGKALPGAYCPACGQKAQALRQPIHHFLRDAFVEFFGIDGRVWRSLGVLLFKPGRLTRIYISGQRVRYLRPLRIYLSSTLLFFVLLATVDPTGRLERALQDGDGLGGADTVLVATHIAENDSLLAALPIEWANEDATRDSLLARADALRESIQEPDSTVDVDDIEDIQEDIDELVDDASDRSGGTPRERALRLAELRTESAVLATFPQDSLIVPEDLHAWLDEVYPSSNIDVVVGPDWLTRSRSAQLIQSAKTNKQRIEAASLFARDVIGQVPTVMFIVLPIFAFLMKLLYARRDWFYSEHVVFALHTHAFAFVAFSVMVLLVWLGNGAAWTGVTVALLTLALPVYFLLAMKHVYQQGWVRTFVKAWLLSWMYGFVLLIGLVAAFLLAAFFG
ncbi:MAG: hypothetical protein Rubg2KO_16360 [Rubricoccaceae bacterium]